MNVKMLVKIGDGLTLQAEGTPQEVFQQISDVQETFEDTKCGLCGKTDLKYVCRTVEDNTFYELKCKVCYGKLTYGQSKADKKLYPRRFKTDDKGKAIKDEDGKGVRLGRNGNGWVKYNKETGEEE